MTTQTIAEPISQNQTQRKWILFAVCILGIMIQVDYSAINVALASISASLNITLTTVQWVLSAYVLAWGAWVMTAGRLSDLYGKRRLFIIGTVIFILGSAFSGLATSAWFLILSRALQGVGGALFIPALYTLVFAAYPSSERGKAMGILSGAISIGMAIGPTLGGIFTHWLSWRYIFFVNVPLGFCVVAIILSAVPKEPRKLLDESMDYIGAILLAVIITSLMFGIDQLKVAGVSAMTTVSSFAISLVLFPIFLLVERRSAYPILKLSIFKNKSFVGCLLNNALMGYNFAAILIIGGLYLQSARGFSAFDTGLIFLAMTFSFGILSVYGGHLADRMDKRIPIIAGGLGMIMATFLFANLSLTSPMWLILLMFALSGLAFGLAFPALNTAMMAAVEDTELNIASGTFTMFGTLGNTIGLILSAVSIVFFGQNKLFSLVENLQISLPEQLKQVLLNAIASTHYAAANLSGFTQEQIPKVLGALHQAFIYAMSCSLYIAMIFGIISVLLGWFLIRDFKQKETNAATSNEVTLNAIL